MHSRSLRHFLWLFVASFVVLGAHAQGPDQLPFYWGFSTIDDSVTSLPECARVKLWITDNNKAKLQPPYYLFAYEANGIPTVNPVGSDPDSLFWTIDHPRDSKLILTMTDARGTSGGVSIHYYTVTGGTSSCHSSLPTSPISMSTNISSTLNTCDVLPVVISGGVKPYTLTVVVLNTHSVFNISMDSFDGYDWVNQTPPNMHLLATAIDAMGTYGVSTPLLATAGGTDIKCNGLQSRPFNSSDPDVSGLHKPKPSGKMSKSPIIAGIVVGLGLPAIAIAGFLFFRWKRDRARQNSRDSGPSSDGHVTPGGDRSVPSGDYSAVPVVERAAPSPVMGAAPHRDYHQTVQNAGPLLFTQNQHGSVYTQSSYSSTGDPLTMGLMTPVQPVDHLWRNSSAAPVLYSVVPAGSVLVPSQLPPGAMSMPTLVQQPLPPGAMSTPTLVQQPQQWQQVYSPTLEGAHNSSAHLPRGYASPLTMYSTTSPLVPLVVGGPGPRPGSMVESAASASASPPASASVSAAVRQQPAAGGSKQTMIVTNPGGDEPQVTVAAAAAQTGAAVTAVPQQQQQAQPPSGQHEGVEATVARMPPSYRVRS